MTSKDGAHYAFQTVQHVRGKLNVWNLSDKDSIPVWWLKCWHTIDILNKYMHSFWKTLNHKLCMDLISIWQVKSGHCIIKHSSPVMLSYQVILFHTVDQSLSILLFLQYCMENKHPGQCERKLSHVGLT